MRLADGIRHYLQEEDDDAKGGGGSPTPTERKRYVEQQLDERYVPREVRELLAKHGDKPEIALEHVVKENNDVVQRLIKRRAELEFDLQAAQNELKARDDQIKAVEGERDTAIKQLEERTAEERGEALNAKLKTRFNDDEVLVRRHQAYLALDGYALELDGENIMLVKDGKRHKFDTIVNDAWYERYTDAKPASDTPLPRDNPPAPPRAGNNGSSELGKEIAGAFQKRDEISRKFANLGAPNG